MFPLILVVCAEIYIFKAKKIFSNLFVCIKKKELKSKGIYQPGEPEKLRENELIQGNYGKLRENCKYCCFALIIVKFLCSVDQKQYNFINIFKRFC